MGLTRSVGRAALCLILLGGCGDEEWFIPPPPSSGTAAIWVRDGALSRLWIFSEWPDSSLRVELADSGSVVVTGLVFEGQTPDILELPVGELELGAEGPLTRRLPEGAPPARAYSISATGDWEPLETVPIELRSLHFRDERICPSFEIEELYVELAEPTLGFYFATSLGEESAVLATPEGEVFHLAPDRGLIPVQLNGVEGQLSAVSSSNGRLWVGTHEGRVYRGADDQPFDLSLVATSSAAAIDRILVTQVQDHDEILIVDRERWLWHHDGLKWSRIHHFVEDNTAISSKDLFEIEPGHVLASSLSDSKIVRFRAGRFTVEEPAIRPISGFNRVTHYAGFGSLASATLGELYSDHTGSWIPHMQVTTAVNLGAMGPAEGGLLTASIFGGVELLYPDLKLACGTIDRPGLIRTDYIGRYRGSTLLAGPRREPETRASLFLIRSAARAD